MWFLLAILAGVVWAISNVADSIVVRRIEQNPVLILWIAGAYRLVFLAVFPLFFRLESPWALPLFLCGACYYLSALLYTSIIRHIDISLINAAWALKSVLLSIIGLLFFREAWGIFHFVGALLVVSGVLVLSLWHKHISMLWTISLFSVIALAVVPADIANKAALLGGVHLPVVIFWSMLGNTSFYTVTPLLLPKYRKLILGFLRSPRMELLLGVFASTASAIIAFFLLVWAFAVGPISLVAIIGNIQPFLVILLAWLLTIFAPSWAPREILSWQSLRVKIGCFCIVFSGLAFIAIG